MTHEEVVQRAVRWLFGTQRCRCVIAGKAPGYRGEVPDAIGWQHDTASILVECKTSMADFYSDRGKPWRRRPEIGIGRYRWYLLPPGVIDLTRNTIPVNWGLLIAQPKRIKVVIAAWPQREINIKREMKLLIDSKREQNPIEQEREGRDART